MLIAGCFLDWYTNYLIMLHVVIWSSIEYPLQMQAKLKGLQQEV